MWVFLVMLASVNGPRSFATEDRFYACSQKRAHIQGRRVNFLIVFDHANAAADHVSEFPSWNWAGMRAAARLTYISGAMRGFSRGFWGRMRLARRHERDSPVCEWRQRPRGHNAVGHFAAGPLAATDATSLSLRAPPPPASL